MPRKSAEDDAYTGPLVTIRHTPPGWTVAVEPVLPNGEGEPRKYPCKMQAFNEASRLWTAHKLGAVDFTNHNTGRNFDE